jgi:hypothetical protein
MSTVHEKDNKAERPQHIDDSAAASRDSATIIDRQTSQDDMEPMPEVDFARAATIKPSRLHGKSLYFMVSFVAGTGVSGGLREIYLVRGCGALLIGYSSRSLVTTKV